jgi:hypothetical protein
LGQAEQVVTYRPIPTALFAFLTIVLWRTMPDRSWSTPVKGSLDSFNRKTWGLGGFTENLDLRERECCRHRTSTEPEASAQDPAICQALARWFASAFTELDTPLAIKKLSAS